MFLGSKTDTQENLALKLFFGAVAAGWTRPVAFNNWQLGLFTTLPADDGTGGVEAVGNGYARVNIANDDTKWSTPASITSTLADALFAALTGPIAETPGWGLWDNAGVLRYWGACVTNVKTAQALAAGDTLSRGTNDGFANGDTVRIEQIDALPLPGNLAQLTNYYVVNVAAGTMQLAAAFGGAAIDINADGVCRVAKYFGKSWVKDDQPLFPAGSLTITED